MQHRILKWPQDTEAKTLKDFFDPLVQGIAWKYLMQENRSNPKQRLATSALAKTRLTHAPRVTFYSEEELS